jgi:hypothetical protein
MPVLMTLTGVPSNKQEGGKGKKKIGQVPINNISYIPIKERVAVLKPIIDKISITYKIADPDLKAALSNAYCRRSRRGVSGQAGHSRLEALDVSFRRQTSGTAAGSGLGCRCGGL